MKSAVLALALALAGCGSASRAPVADPPGPPVVEPPPPVVPPPAVEIVEGVTVRVTLGGTPVAFARVRLAPGVEAPTDAEGVARFARLNAGAYEATVDLLPARVRAPSVVIEVSGAARAFHLAVAPTFAGGTIALLGDSDSSEPVEWRATSVLDHLAAVPAWSLGAVNVAEPCTSAAHTDCPHDGLTQARALPEGVDVVVVRFGLNDLHYGVPTKAFRDAYSLILDEIARRGALAIVVAPQEEADPYYRAPRRAYVEALAQLADAKGALYVDPGISWTGDRDMFVVDVDGERGVHLGDAGVAEVAAAVDRALTAALTTGDLDLAPPDPVKPCAAAFLERYALMVSNYGALCADESAFDTDSSWLADLDVCGQRIWVDWRWEGRSCSAYRSDGSPREDVLARLDHIVEYSASLGAELDLTFGGGDWYDDIEAHARAVRDLAARYAGRPGIAFLDLWNEADSALTRSRAVTLVSAARAGDSERLLTISLSSGASGDPDAVIDGYREIRDLVDFAAPHWPRKEGWWERSVPYSLELEAATALEVGLQEEARQKYQGDDWPTSAYLSVERDACTAGLPLYTQHTEAGFQPWLGTLREQLDPVTMEALEMQGAAGCP